MQKIVMMLVVSSLLFSGVGGAAESYVVKTILQVPVSPPAQSDAGKDSKPAEEKQTRLEEAKHLEQIKGLQAALGSAEARFRAADADRLRLQGELKIVKELAATVQAQLKTLADGGKGKLLALADKGEAISFRGVGEAVMASADGKTILRFPIDVASKAARAFMGTRAERQLQGVFVYYIIDSNLLAF